MLFITRVKNITVSVGLFLFIALTYPPFAEAETSIGQLDKSTSVFLAGFTSDSVVQHLGKGIRGVIDHLCIDIADGWGEDANASFSFWYQPTDILSAGGADRTYIFADNLFPAPATETVSCKTFNSHAFKPDQYYFINLAPRYPRGLIVFGSEQSSAWGDETSDLVKTTCPIYECVPTAATVKDIYFSGIEKRDAVILIPGILGTKLDFTTIAPPLNIWPSPNELVKADDEYLNLLSLGINGLDLPGRSFIASDIIQNITALGLFTKNIYGNIVNLFENNGYANNMLLFQYPYDWRLNLSTTAQGLAQTIQTAAINSESGKVNIVAHSMGGLLLKEYLRTAPANTINRINKVIFLGTPHLGAPKASKVLLYGDNLNISILDEERARIITQNMPSVYQLLPSQKYINDFSGYITDARSEIKKVLSHDSTNQFLSDSGLNSSLLTNANVFHTTLDTYPNASSIKFFDIIGCGSTKTISSIIIKNNGKFDLRYTLGDKTVPYVSASSVGNINQRYFSNADHMDLVQNTGVLEQLINIFDGKSGQIAEGVSTSTTSCASNDPTIIFATHSPVNLHIYDSQGNHLGPDANGDIEYGIPGSSYDTIGDNHFAVVPDSATTTYRIVIQAYASGTFDFDWSKLTGSAVTERTSYLNQPLQTASTTATFTYTSDATNPLLAIDNEGNGSVDKTVAASAKVSGAAAADATPPTISVNFPNSFELLRAGTLWFWQSAQDAESGISLFETRIDGVLAPGSSLYLPSLKLGPHTLNLLAYDKAGNPRETTIPFFLSTDGVSTIEDVKIAFILGQIKSKDARNNLIDTLNTIVKLQNKILDLQSKLSSDQIAKLTQQQIVLLQIAKLRAVIDKKLATDFLGELERKYKNGIISFEAYTLLKEDVNWMLQ